MLSEGSVESRSGKTEEDFEGGSLDLLVALSWALGAVLMVNS